MARLPRFISHNWQLKLAALGLSVFLWALVQTPLSDETFPAVPVRVDVADTAWTASGSPEPATVELRLAGPAREMIRLAREGMVVRVPVSSVGSRDTIITLQREWVQLGSGAGVRVESISPSAVRVAFEQAVTRRVPVALRLRGELPEDLAFSTPLAVSPTTVRASGAVSRMAGLDSIPLMPFDLGRVEDSGAFTVNVDTTGLAGISIAPRDVVLGVRVEPRVERILEDMTVHADPRPGERRVVVDPPAVPLRLSGARSVMTSLDLSLVRVSVAPEAIAGMQPGETRRVRLRVEGLPALVSAYPETEVVTVRPAAAAQGGVARNRP